MSQKIKTFKGLSIHPCDAFKNMSLIVEAASLLSGFALAILTPPCIYAICKGLVVTVNKEKK